MITFTPLAGGAQSSQTTPLCYLLQVDDVRILLDCGSPDWNPEIQGAKVEDGDDTGEELWDQYTRSLESIAYTVDLVLLSHGDLAHAGLIPYAYSRWNLRAPSYCTLPVQAMARIAVVDHVETLRAEEDVDTGVINRETYTDIPEQDGGDEVKFNTKNGKCIATLKQVHDAFDSFTTLRYSQPTHLQGKCQGLTITPYNAGHTLGGTIWKIRSPTSGTILYAVDLNHTRERHLDGTVILRPSSGGVGVFEPLARPDLLITDAERALVVSSRRKDRDSFFLDVITSTLRTNSLLIPCDASTRLLELLVLLDQHWSFSKLKSPICLISSTGEEMLTFVRSMMEWLGGTISKEDVGDEGRKRKRGTADDDRDFGAFALRFPHLEFFSSPAALTATYPSSKPKLILAVPASLSHGSSRALFADFASVRDNVVLLTSRSEENTLSRLLLDKWNQRQQDDDRWDKGNIGSVIELDESIHIKLNSKVPLQGSELEAYLRRERAAKERQAAHQAAMARTQMMLEADEDDSESEDSDSESDEDLQGGADEGMDMEATTSPAVLEPGGGGGTRRRGGKQDAGGTRERGDWAFDQEEALTRQLLSYDIYLKGNVSRTTSFFKTAAGQTQRFRMFPYVERKRRVDSYGETIDVGMWLRKGKALEEDAETEEVREAKRSKLAEDEAKKAAVEPPSKFVSHNVDVRLSCKLCFVDMEGLNDGRALKTIVPQVNPRKMIIVHASRESTENLVESCGAIRAMTRDIHAPALGDTCQIGQHTNSFSISLSDELLASVKMSSFEDNEVGFVVGRITSHATSSIPILEPAPPIATAGHTEDDDDAKPIATMGVRPIANLPRSTMIGDLKLTALKSRLAKLGIAAEFAGEGVLVCGGAASKTVGETVSDSIAVRKTGRGKVVIEGTVSEVYYTVRKEVYNLHALVAA